MDYFLVTARDAEDEGAFDRRMGARADHLAALERLKAEGTVRFALATVGQDGRLNGSVMVFACKDQAEADRLVRQDPYVAANVWGAITIQPCRIAPLFDKPSK